MGITTVSNLGTVINHIINSITIIICISGIPVIITILLVTDCIISNRRIIA